MASLAERLATALGDRYDIGELIGAGGMATVFRARDRKHGRDVAVKVLRPEMAASFAGERFLREIRIAANLHHPNILQLFDSGEADGMLFYIMPLVRGETLRQMMDRQGPMPVDDVIRLVTEVAGALDYAHQHGIVHRDIKPENILIESGHALVADFGVGRALSGAREQGEPVATLTAAGFAVGTPQYMSPEQIDGVATLDGRSDLYSLACACYEMLAGKPPFPGAAVSLVLRKHLLEPPPSITAARPDVSPIADAALQKAMAKAPDQRFDTVSDFARSLHTGMTPVTVPVAQLQRKSKTVYAVGAAVVLLIAAAAFLWFRMRPASDSESAVAVLPFTVRGNDTLQLGEGMMTLLSTKLDGAAGLRTVDARALLGYLERSGNSAVDVERAREIARRFSAGMFVLGDVVMLGEHVQLTAGLYSMDRARAVQEASAEGPTSMVFELVDQLAAKLLAERSSGGAGLDSVASVTTSSLPAFKAYLDGEREMRAGNFDQALSSYQRAIAADSTFALAWYRLSVAAEWLTRQEVVRDASARAQALSTHLPERTRALLQAAQAAREGQFERAEQQYRSITGAAPEDVESWIQLGELLFHNAAIHGRDFRESREPWGKVMALEPDNMIPLVHLARVAAADRDTATLDDLVSRISRIRAGSGQDSSAARAEELEVAMMRAAMVNDSAGIERSLHDLSRSSELTITITAWDVATVAGNPGVALRIGDLLGGPARTSQARSLGCRMRSTLLMGLGQFNAADRQLDRCVALDPALGVYWRIYFATLPFHERLDHAFVPASFDSIVEPAVPAPSDMSSWVTGHTGTYGHVRTWLVGLTAAMQGNQALAERSATQLDAVSGSSDLRSAAAALADGIRAELAYRRQNYDEALRLLLKPHVTAVYLLAGSSPYYGGPRERFRKAELLERAGRHEEALTWYGSFDNLSFYEAPFEAAAQQQRGAILEKLGRKAEAAEAYRRFIAFWRDADPDLQPEVTQARERLAALQPQ